MKNSVRTPRLIAVSGLILAAAILSGCSDVPATATPAPESASNETLDVPESSSPFRYERYDALLKQYVDGQGSVDYAGLKSDRGDLDTFVESMGRIDSGDYESWSKNEKLALWINAYNAITLQYIIDHYPIQKGGFVSSLRFPENSIRQIPGVWDKLTTSVVGKNYTLDAIEHDVLRAQFDEPRMHVAIVCASKSCPPLRNEAFVPGRLDDQLNSQSRTFLGSPDNFRIDKERGRVYLSVIFSWFGRDFTTRYKPEGALAEQGKKKGAVLRFVSHYASEEDARYLNEERYSIDYQEYDWSLNEQ